MQQIMAYETDLLEYGDIFDGSAEITAKVEALKAEARAELACIAEMGGAVAAVESSYMKQKLVESNTRRLEAIERKETIVVGVNAFTDSEPSPLGVGEGAIQVIDPAVEAEQIARLEAWRAQRDSSAVRAALQHLEAAAHAGENVMEASIACAKAGVTTGEWSTVLRAVFGEYRAPTGVGRAMRDNVTGLDAVRSEVERVSKALGRRLKFLVGKPGLDGHSNGAEQIAVRARDCGMEVVYEGIRLTPAQIVNAALEEGVHVVGLSILSGSHVPLVKDVMARLEAKGLADLPVIVGGIIPPEDAAELRAAGVAAVYTPKDFDLNRIMADIVRIVGTDTRRAA
jgi:(2R)-ethylmalonyl-CoA mutase